MSAHLNAACSRRTWIVSRGALVAGQADVGAWDGVGRASHCRAEFDRNARAILPRQDHGVGASTRQAAITRRLQTPLSEARTDRVAGSH